jgi:heme O synthase-like polyprenyltransferase
MSGFCAIFAVEVLALYVTHGNDWVDLVGSVAISAWSIACSVALSKEARRRAAAIYAKAREP